MLGAFPSKALVKESAKKGAEKYKSLDSTAKTAVNMGGILAIGLALFTGYKVIKGIGSTFKNITGQQWSEDRKNEEKTERNTIKTVLDNSNTKPTLSSIEAKNIADNMFRAFLNTQPEWSRNLWDEGTDEKMLFANLNLLKNKADWLLVSLKFGMPRRRNLASELNYELTAKEMQKAREVLLKINVKI